MREKGGLHMEKMEHMDPQRCDRIWQRVSPELDPYPDRETKGANLEDPFGA